MPATFSLMEHHASWSVLSVPSVVHSFVHLLTWSCPGPMLFVCGGFYDGYKPVVEPLAQPVYMLADHTRTRQGEVARLLGALVRGISYLRRWGHNGNGFQPLPLTQCCLQARDWNLLESRLHLLPLASTSHAHYSIQKAKRGLWRLCPGPIMRTSDCFLPPSRLLPLPAFKSLSIFTRCPQAYGR